MADDVDDAHASHAVAQVIPLQPAAAGRSAKGPAAELAAAHLGIVRFQARQVARQLGRYAAEDELVSVGSEALVLAARSHDPTRAPFEPYAMQKVRWAMLDFARRDTHARANVARRRAGAILALEELGATSSEAEAADAMPTEQDVLDAFRDGLAAHAAALFLGLSTSTAPAATEGPEGDLMRARASAAIERALAKLPDRERGLIEGHYFRGERFDEMADSLGLSKSRVSRLHSRALARLGDLLKDYG